MCYNESMKKRRTGTQQLLQVYERARRAREKMLAGKIPTPQNIEDVWAYIFKYSEAKKMKKSVLLKWQGVVNEMVDLYWENKMDKAVKKWHVKFSQREKQHLYDVLKWLRSGQPHKEFTIMDIEKALKNHTVTVVAELHHDKALCAYNG